MTGFGEFSKRITMLGDSINSGINNKTKRIARAADTLIVKAMPVDTGLAKSSVVVTLGAPSTAQMIEAYFPGSKGSTSGLNAQAAIDQAEGVLKDRKLGEEIHITINLPYIDDLNQGKSPQAQAGFIQQAVADAVSTESGVSIVNKK